MKWRPTTDAFLCGWGACAAVTSLMQDALGKERYLKAVSERWVDGIYTVPLAAAALVCAVLGLFFARKSEVSR